MPKKGPEFRVAVGAPDGRRSTVWKFTVTRNEIYIFTRMFGSDAKVSLHSSGECQWSCTSSWVMAETGRRNADRHIVKWDVELPEGDKALHIFRVSIPESELRPIEGEDIAGVEWLDSPGAGNVVTLDCYLTRAVDVDPGLGIPHPCLISWQLQNKRWFVVMIRTGPVERDYSPERMEMVRQAQEAGIRLDPRNRIAAFGGQGTEPRFLIEIVPVG